MKKFVPHVLTCCGLLAGMCGFIALADKAFVAAFYWVCVAACFDVLDGAVARALGVSSHMGKLLDSLVDVVCFGALPALWMYTFILHKDPDAMRAAYGALIIAPCAAWRLATFATQPDSSAFKGLPTPAAALFLLSLHGVSPALFQTYADPAFWLLLISWGVGALMLSSVPLIGMKFTHIRWRGNQARYVLLGVAVAEALWLQEKLFLALIPSYVLVSLLAAHLERRFTRPTR